MGLGQEVGSKPLRPCARCCPFLQQLCPLPRGGSGQPLLTLAHPQRFQKAIQPLHSWRAAAGRNMDGVVIVWHSPSP